MNRNAIGTDRQTPHTIERHESWCDRVRHEEYDAETEGPTGCVARLHEYEGVRTNYCGDWGQMTPGAPVKARVQHRWWAHDLDRRGIEAIRGFLLDLDPSDIPQLVVMLDRMLEDLDERPCLR